MNQKLRVGVPATAAAHRIPEFLNHVNMSNMSRSILYLTHGYADDTVKDLFGTDEDIPMRDRVCRAVKKVHDEIGSFAVAIVAVDLVGVECAIVWRSGGAR